MTDSQNAGPLLRDSIRQRLDFNVMHCPKYHEQIGFEPARHIKDSRSPAVKTQIMYCITLRNKFDKTIVGWYDASASNFSNRPAAHGDLLACKDIGRENDADFVADQLRRMYPRLAQDIEVTAVQPTGLTCSSDRRSRVAMI